MKAVSKELKGQFMITWGLIPVLVSRIHLNRRCLIPLVLYYLDHPIEIESNQQLLYEQATLKRQVKTFLSAVHVAYLESEM